MFVKILIGLAVVLVIFVIVVAMQPADFKITRSITIAAPPAAVFPNINELKKWEAWSPWQKLDPAMKQTYEGPVAGVGAKQSWSGNNQVGEGSMTIVDSKANELVRTKLEFIKPMAATNEAELTLKPEGSDTLVTWTMTGKNNFVFKMFHLVMNMDKMLGGQFDQGLQQLKAVVEKK